MNTGPVRKKPTDNTATDILVRSKRRCALCFGLHGDLSIKDGQLAHIDRDPSNSSAENLCFLCLPHHNSYDTRFSQSKGLTEAELRYYKKRLELHLDSDDAGTLYLPAIGRPWETGPSSLWKTLPSVRTSSA